MLNVIYSSILYICFYATIGLLVIWIFFLFFVICSIYIQMKHSGFNSDVKCMEVRVLNGYLQYITKKKKKVIAILEAKNRNLTEPDVIV